MSIVKIYRPPGHRHKVLLHPRFSEVGDFFRPDQQHGWNDLISRYCGFQGRAGVLGRLLDPLVVTGRTRILTLVTWLGQQSSHNPINRFEDREYGTDIWMSALILSTRYRR
ncbi:hypothetical protein [Sphingomonas sp. PP-CE-1G-424]|uniref:hypothetical protein n=1 Tax=Sphingomonas sp. PP-CE-1G-424 TaxID=2135658 RepID=UPI001055A47E|nr:hypothetical protein [Sphingomonas sp. PP-CE-1G-424]